MRSNSENIQAGDQETEAARSPRKNGLQLDSSATLPQANIIAKPDESVGPRARENRPIGRSLNRFKKNAVTANRSCEMLLADEIQSHLHKIGGWVESHLSNIGRSLKIFISSPVRGFWLLRNTTCAEPEYYQYSPALLVARYLRSFPIGYPVQIGGGNARS